MFFILHKIKIHVMSYVIAWGGGELKTDLRADLLFLGQSPAKNLFILLSYRFSL